MIRATYSMKRTKGMIDREMEERHEREVRDGRKKGNIQTYILRA